MATSLRFITVLLAWLVFTPAVLPQARVDALGDPLPEGAIARLGTTRMRHFHLPDRYCWGLGCITWSTNGRMIATTSYADGPIGVEAKLWDASTGKPLSLLENNTRYRPLFVRFSPDNKTLVAAAGNKIVLWDAATGKESGQLLGHQGEVDALVFQDGGRTLVSVSQDGAVHWWDVAGRKVVRAWQLLANDPNKTEDGAPILLRGIHKARFSADGKTLVVAKWWTTKSEKPSGANLAIVYDLNARKELWREDDDDAPYCFALAPDGKRLAIAKRGLLRLLETATGRPVTDSRWLYVSGMDWAPDGKTLALCMNGQVVFWSPDARTPLREVEVPLQGGGYNTFATDPAFAPDGKKLAIDRRMTFRVLDVATGKPTLSWPSYDQGFRSLAFSADGRTLFESRADISIDTATWQQRTERDASPWQKFSAVQGVSLDRTLCVAADGKHRATLFNVKTGRALAHLDAPERQPGQRLGFFSPKTGLYVMRDQECSGKETTTLLAIPSGKRLFQVSFNRFTATRGWCFSADESRAAFFELGARRIHVYDTATGKLLWLFVRGDGDASLALSPNGNMLAVGAVDLRNVNIWDLRTGKHHRSLVLKQDPRYRDHVCLVWSSDNRMLAVGGVDNSIRLWEVASAQVRREFRGHEAQVTSVAFSPDGKLLVSGSEDTTMLVWKTLADKKRRDPPTQDELAVLWENLAADAGKAHQAQTELLHAPNTALAYLGKQLQPAPAVDPVPVAAWIKNLGSDEFRVRDKAAKELATLGELARGPIRKALTADPPLETRRRLEELLDKLNTLTSAQLRYSRAIEILERIGTPEAVCILERLTEGNPDCLATTECRLVVARMQKKN